MKPNINSHATSNQRFVDWNNNVNPIKKEKSRLKRKISYDELVSALKDLGFYEKSTNMKKIEEIFDEILKD